MATSQRQLASFAAKEICGLLLLLSSRLFAHHSSTLGFVPSYSKSYSSSSWLSQRAHLPLPLASMAEFSRLVVPKAPRTSTENVQKKESVYWKSFKVQRAHNCHHAVALQAHTPPFTVSPLHQVLRSHLPCSILPFLAPSLRSHLGYSPTNLLAQNEPRRQDHLAIQGRRNLGRDSYRRQALYRRRRGWSRTSL